MDACQKQIDDVPRVLAVVPRPARWSCAAWATALVLSVALAPAWAAAQEVEVLLPEKECQVKYALLYSFGLLTTWPAEAFEGKAEGPFVIGVLGTKPFPEYLTRIAQTKKINSRTIVIQRYKNPEEIRRCQILYVTDAVVKEHEQAVLQKLAKQPVLVVSERPPEPGHSSATIQFVIEQGVVKFLLNADDARTHQLQIDPRLLKLRKQPPSETKP